MEESKGNIINIQDELLMEKYKQEELQAENHEQQQRAQKILNSDIQMHVDNQQEQQKQKRSPNKHIIRETVGGGTVFETQVEVIEREVLLDNN